MENAIVGTSGNFSSFSLLTSMFAPLCIHLDIQTWLESRASGNKGKRVIEKSFNLHRYLLTASTWSFFFVFFFVSFVFFSFISFFISIHTVDHALEVLILAQGKGKMVAIDHSLLAHILVCKQALVVQSLKRLHYNCI